MYSEDLLNLARSISDSTWESGTGVVQRAEELCAELEFFKSVHDWESVLLTQKEIDALWEELLEYRKYNFLIYREEVLLGVSVVERNLAGAVNTLMANYNLEWFVIKGSEEL